VTSPVPGFVAPSPRTWSPGDIITTPRLRGDMTNLGLLYAGGCRPMIIASSGLAGVATGASAHDITLALAALNSWNATIIGFGTAGIYPVPLPGWWLCQGVVNQSGIVSGGTQAKFSMGFNVIVNGSGVTTDGASVPASSGYGLTGGSGCELFQFNTFAETTDALSVYAYTNLSGGTTSGGFLMGEWVGLPDSGATLTGYTGPYGTVVTSPAAAASFPPGPGTTLASSVAAGATSVTVASATGIVAGGTLGLDFLSGQYYQPYAEAVTVTSVAGTTVGISPAAYAHSSGAPVAIPVSAAFLNQQCRDVVNFLSYPPMLRAQVSTTQSLGSSAFPAGTQITNLSASQDNFGGFASNAYTAPVAGTYLVYGQVYLAGSTSAYEMAAGIQQNSGTIQWGTRFQSSTSSGAQSFCATVRRLLRLAAGDTITLYGTQNSGSAMSTEASGSTYCKLICLWRST
jgi:hypothetical protein